jgi:hypothetical protein
MIGHFDLLLVHTVKIEQTIISLNINLKKVLALIKLLSFFRTAQQKITKKTMETLKSTKVSIVLPQT